MKSSIGLGTAAIGRPVYLNIRPSREKSAGFDLTEFKLGGEALLQEAYELGIRDFDTAPGYGIAEEIILEWINAHGYEDVRISTKWGYTYVADFNPDAEVHEVKEHSLNKLNEQWEFSSKFFPRLKTYQIHSATLESGVLDNAEVLNRLNQLKQKHDIQIGVTVTGANQNEIIRKALQVVINGEPLFESFQLTFNVFDQSYLEIQELLIGKKLIVKEALANGRIFPNNAYHNYASHYVLMTELAQKYGVGIDAIGLRFCMDTIHSGVVLSGASSIQQLKRKSQGKYL